MNEVKETKKETSKETDKAIEKPKEKESGIFGKIKKIKNFEIIVAVIAVAVMMLIYFTTKVKSCDTSSPTGTAATTPDASDQLTQYCNKIENEFTAAVSRIKGAGETQVIINWESSAELIIAYITNSSESSTSSSPQVISGSGGAGPIILKEIYPKVLGVIIVCKGGNSVSVKMDIVNAAMTLLNITADKVNVYGME